MGSQQISYNIDVDLNTDGGYCTGPSGQTSDFTITGFLMTCPESATLTIQCGGANCYGQASRTIGYMCGDSPVSCGAYSICTNTYYGGTDNSHSHEHDYPGMNLNCTCDPFYGMGYDHSDKFEALGGCGEYTGCPEAQKTQGPDACGDSWSGLCGNDCPVDVHTSCEDYNETTGGTCTCMYECPTDCASGHSCDYYSGGVCNDTNNIQADGGRGDCGSCPDPTSCYTCINQCCVVKNRDVYNISSLNPYTIEIGEEENQQFIHRWSSGIDNNGSRQYVGTLTYKVRDLTRLEEWELLTYTTNDHETCSSRYINTEVNEETGYPMNATEGGSSGRFRWNPEKFFKGIYGNALEVIATGTSFQLIVESTWHSARTQNFQIKDDVRAGCTDPLANGDLSGDGVYDANATEDDGTCRYTGCKDENAANYSCGTDGLGNANPNLVDSYACGAATNAEEGDNGYNYTLDDMDDNGLCQFYPIAVVSHSPANVNEGTNISITSTNSTVHDNGTYTCTECTGGLSYFWDITDTDGNDYSAFIVDTHTLNFPIPLMIGENYGGGGILNVNLTIENEQGWSDTLDSVHQISINDVDIIGTQLSNFPPIYIPGGGAYSLIGSYLPPNDDDNRYDMIDLLNSSFFINNPSEADEPIPNIYMTGDYAYVILCANENCAGSDENLDNGFFNYISGVGWFGPEIDLKPGMGIKLQTQNAGWFRWTLPEEV